MSSVLVKFLHIIAIAGWSAGLICLPFLYLQRRTLSGNALLSSDMGSRLVVRWPLSEAEVQLAAG